MTGCEISAFGPGFIPDATYRDRMRTIDEADMEWWSSLGPVLERLSGFLAESVDVVRPRFRGRVTYAAAPWEFVGWSPFDIVGADAYRAAYNTDTFRDEGRVESRRPSLLHLSPGVSPLSSPRVRCSEGEAERPTTVTPPLR